VAAKLRKLQPDVFFSPDGYLSLRTQIPQVPVFHDLAFEHFPQDVKKLEAWHYRRYFPRFARKARKIITVSEYTKSDVMQRYDIPGEKIEVVYNACADHFHPIPAADKAAVRDRFSQGQPYFHSVGAIQPRKNLVRLITAFDKFKEASGAPHKLLIVGRKAWNFEKVIHSYGSSPYKDDIVFTGFVSDAELNLIYAASHGLCYVPYFEGFGLPIMEAMACEVPVITGNITSMPEVAGEAALLVDPYDPQEIADAMLRLYHEPDLPSQLVDKGRARKALFSWDRSAERVWNVLTNG
jgi:glycosyltransferase involved in cell wall biosynthesis